MPDTHTAAPVASSGRAARLRLSSFGLVAMLILQFILGVIYNLYGTAPTSAKSVGMFSSPVLALHVVLFFLLVIAAIMQLIRAVGSRHRLAAWLSAVGLIAILAAGFAGIGFIGNGAAGASLGMSLAFAVALACYVVLVLALPATSTT
jgi:O-antigen/teichoic acid export membrane protein